MAKGQKEAGQKQLNINNAAASGYGKQAGDVYSSLNPFYTAEMTNPQGIGEAGLNASRTATNQALGGSTAGVTGAGALTGARTRNTAGVTAALDSAARGAQEQGSQNEQNLILNNEMLKEQQRQAGAAGEAGLYGANVGAQTSLLGQQAGNLQGRAAGGSFWQNTFNPIMSSLFPEGQLIGKG